MEIFMSNIDLEIKNRLLKAYMLGIALYGREKLMLKALIKKDECLTYRFIKIIEMINNWVIKRWKAVCGNDEVDGKSERKISFMEEYHYEKRQTCGAYLETGILWKEKTPEIDKIVIEQSNRHWRTWNRLLCVWWCGTDSEMRSAEDG